MNRYWLLCLVFSAMQAFPLAAQEPKSPAPPEGPRARGPAAPARPAAPPAAGELKKYDDVVTKDFVTQAGVFAVHRFEEKILFEIPKEKLGKLFLWRAEVAKGPGGSSWGGAALAEEVVRFERRANKIFLWKSGFAKRSDGKAIQNAIDASSSDSIIAAFSVECEGKDRSAVITVSDVFINGLADISISAAAGFAGANVDPARSFISEVKAFSTNIEVVSTITFRGAKSATAVVHHSMVQLPDAPMMGRFFDSRVGYFTESYVDF